MPCCDVAYLGGRVVEGGIVEWRVPEVVGHLQAGAVVKEDLDDDDDAAGDEDEVKHDDDDDDESNDDNDNDNDDDDKASPVVEENLNDNAELCGLRHCLVQHCVPAIAPAAVCSTEGPPSPAAPPLGGGRYKV